MIKRTVIIESPYAGTTIDEIADNVAYAMACMADSLYRGEAPFVSHLLYTQVLKDSIPEQRALGIDALHAWRDKADATVVYVDRGISKGMKAGIEDANEKGRMVEYRNLKKR